MLKYKTLGIHKKCVELTTDKMRLLVTTQVGPRIIGCYIGKDKANQFVQLPATPMKQPANGFTLYGGHRLWHSPEACPLCYEPDNAPVKVTEYESGVEFAGAADPTTGIAKKMLVEPLTNGLFCITHTIENCGAWPVELAPWALSMMAPGGMAVIPQGRDDEGYPYAPDRKLAVWAYSDLKDPRLDLGHDFILLKQDVKAKTNFKIGLNDECGWIAYVTGGTAFVKYFDYDCDGEYPDGGCSIESYTCSKFTEIETLGTLQELDPGECAQHVEYWQGIDGLPKIATEADVVEHLVPRLLASEESCCCDEDCCCGEDDCDCDCHEAEEKPARKKSAKK